MRRYNIISSTSVEHGWGREIKIVGGKLATKRKRRRTWKEGENERNYMRCESVNFFSVVYCFYCCGERNYRILPKRPFWRSHPPQGGQSKFGFNGTWRCCLEVNAEMFLWGPPSTWLGCVHWRISNTRAEEEEEEDIVVIWILGGQITIFTFNNVVFSNRSSRQW